MQRINFQSIPVGDPSRALAFYCDHLGMTVQTDAPYEDGWRWIFLQIPGADTLLHFVKAGDITMGHTLPVLSLVSDNVDADTRRLSDAGATIIDGPSDAPWHQAVRYTLFKDSETNTVLLQSSSAQGA
ncbi:MAG: VOC family protein [Sedimentitalea sp.]